MNDTTNERALALTQTTALYTGRFTGGKAHNDQFLETATAQYLLDPSDPFPAGFTL